MPGMIEASAGTATRSILIPSSFDIALMKSLAAPVKAVGFEDGIAHGGCESIVAMVSFPALRTEAGSALCSAVSSATLVVLDELPKPPLAEGELEPLPPLAEPLLPLPGLLQAATVSAAVIVIAASADARRHLIMV